MSWGNRLVVVLFCFAGLILTLVYKSYHTKFELVSKDYYNDELRYQEKIDGAKQASELGKITVEQNSTEVIIHLPGTSDSGNLSGEAWFYCSSNAVNDRKIALTPSNGNRQVILKKDISRGNYQLKLTWKNKSQQYYSETIVQIL